MVWPRPVPTPALGYLGCFCHVVEILLWALALWVADVDALRNVVHTLVVAVREC